MYRAKRAGKNQVAFHGVLDAQRRTVEVAYTKVAAIRDVVEFDASRLGFTARRRAHRGAERAISRKHGDSEPPRVIYYGAMFGGTNRLTRLAAGIRFGLYRAARACQPLVRLRACETPSCTAPSRPWSR